MVSDLNRRVIQAWAEYSWMMRLFKPGISTSKAFSYRKHKVVVLSTVGDHGKAQGKSPVFVLAFFTILHQTKQPHNSTE